MTEPLTDWAVVAAEDVARAERLAWLTERLTGLGGSDIAAVAGIHPYRSAWQVYHEKVGTVGIDNDAGESAVIGQALEDAVAALWFRRRPWATEPATPYDAVICRMSNPPLLRHRDHPWWIGTPDRNLEDVYERPKAIVEVKLAGPEAWRYQWDGGAVIPRWYEAQAQWYMDLVGVDRCYFAVLVEGRHLHTRVVDRNPRALDLLARAGERFWHDHVVAGVPPDPDGRDRTRDALDALYPALPGWAPCALPDSAAAVIDDYHAWSAAVKEATTKRDAAAQRLIAWLGEHEATDGYLPGYGTETPIVTYRANSHVDFAELGETLAADPTGPQLAQFLRPSSYDLAELKRVVGTKTLNAHRKPSTARRLVVRGAPT